MIVVTGATGNVGRHLVELLAGAGVDVRAVSRDPDAAGFPAGVEVVAGDPARPDTMREALSGVRAVVVNPRAVHTAAASLLTLAAELGAEQVVTLSAINVDDDLTRQPSRYRGDLNRETEQATVTSSLPWVSLRPSVFATNTIGLWAAQLHRGDVVRGSYADAAAAPIHERDIAAVAAHALAGGVAPGTRLELTGPESLTQREMVAIIGDALGRPLSYAEVSPAAAREGMLGQGFPAAFADGYLAMQASTVGAPARVTTTVADLLGHPAATFAHWAAEHTPAFRVAPATVGGIR